MQNWEEKKGLSRWHFYDTLLKRHHAVYKGYDKNKVL
jgi:hypothetical protein|nr:MAG TPA: hypothetical protein [Caudoviricetes sp.]DAV79902.1 MAG TPA: hypothetical protein [Caudoviricetes sp.]